MNTKLISIFSGITFCAEEDGLVEQASESLFPEQQDVSLDDIREAMQPFALLVPEKIRLSPHWEGHYRPGKLQPLKQSVPKSDQDYKKLLQLVKQVVQTMAELHHRGLGLGMLTASRLWQNEQGELRIAGFYLVRSFTEVPRLLQLANEDLLYLPPEYSDQLALIPDHRAGLYSLGIVLFHWLTGTFPFSGKDGLEIIHQHLSLPTGRRSQVNPKVAGETMYISVVFCDIRGGTIPLKQWAPVRLKGKKEPDNVFEVIQDI